MTMIPQRLLPNLLFTAGLTACLCGPVRAEPVQVQHAGGEGSGYTFRRGSTCTVLTAQHVVLADDVPAADLVVLDRSGAKAAGRVAYSNPAYDLALISLPDNSGVACSTPWPETIALASAKLNSSTRFEAVRHYPDGRESLILLSYAGGTADELSLAPVDRSGIRESDSGSIVMLNDQPAGIVLRIQTRDDRIDVLRFDRIDQLVGDRFRSAAGAKALAFAGVFMNSRENPAWTTYVRSWFTEKSGWSVVAAGNAAAACTVQVNVASWNHSTRQNDDFTQKQENATKVCARNGFLAEQLCKVAKREVEDSARTLAVHSITLEVTMTQPSGAMASKLGTSGYEHDSGLNYASAEAELPALQRAVSGIATEMLQSGACR